jgi:acyl carrier protein
MFLAAVIDFSLADSPRPSTVNLTYQRIPIRVCQSGFSQKPRPENSRGHKEKSMDRDEIKAKLKAIIAEASGLSVDTIADSARLVEDLGLDSLAILETMVEVDYGFDVKIPDDTIGKIRTVDDTVNIIDEYLSVGVPI